MTADEAVKRLDTLKGGDNDQLHGRADLILCEFIRDAGFPEVAEAWQRADERIGFWYA